MPTGSKAQPNELNDALTQVIRMKMAQLQFTITDLGREAEIPRPTLSRILSNQKDPEFSQLQRVAGALGMPMSKLLETAENILAGKSPL